MRLLLPLTLATCLLLPACGETEGIQRDRAMRAAVRALEAGDTGEALKQIDRAIELDPNQAHLHQVRGSVLYHAGEYKQAVEAYDEAYRLNDRSAEAALGAALALRHLGRDTTAHIRLKRAQELYTYRATHLPDPEQFSKDKIATHELDARLHLALITALKGETKAALTELERLEGAHPDYAKQITLWRAAIASGRFEELLTSPHAGG